LPYDYSILIHILIQLSSGGGASSFSGNSGSAGQQLAQSGNLDALLLQFFYSNPTVAALANVSLETLIPQIQVTLGPFGINVTQILDNALGTNVTGFTVNDLLLAFIDTVTNALVLERNYTGKQYFCWFLMMN
jgi:hypothetical protein